MQCLYLTLALCALVFGQEIDLKINPTLETVTSASWVTAPPATLNASVCYRYVGCFDTFPPFDNTAGVLPNPLERIGTVFLLYTPKKPGIGQQIDYKDQGVSLGRSDFNTRYPTKFIIHGFTQSEREKWVHQMKDALMTTGPMNVVIVGWKGGAAAPDYPKAVANTRVLGKQVQLLVELMVKRGMDMARVHFIGHSLGAHVAGYAGRDLGGKVGRISGMDPAGPLYETYDPRIRLDPTDAIFVDVIHSNAKKLVDMGAGMYTPCGHVDFYPNGGQEQPGCPDPIKGAIGKLLSLNFNGAFKDIACAHSRSHQMYIESIRTGNHCGLRGFPCSGWEDYENGKCGTCGDHGCSELGYHSLEYASRGTFYLMTKGFKTPSAPKGESFCGVTYDIEILPTKDSKNVKGKISLKIKGTKDQIVTPFQGEKDELDGDAKVIIVDYHELGEPTSMELSYEKYGGWSFFSIGAGADDWKVDHIVLQHDDKEYKFCGSGALQVKTGNKVTLKRC